MATHRYILPELTFTLSHPKGQPIPRGTTVSINVPLDTLEQLPTDPSPVTPAEPEEAVATPAPEQIEEIPTPSDPGEAVATPPPAPLPQPTFHRDFDDPRFRAELKRFEKLGSATELNLSGESWTMRLPVTFVDFSTPQRIIGSSSASEAGSSLQIGVLPDGRLWLDTFKGSIVGPILELDTPYDLWVTMDQEGREMMLLGDEIVSSGQVPNFVSQGDIYVGRWLNAYHSFDLESITIYPYLQPEEIRAIRSS